ncbi:MAG: hypothetical protein M0C28_17795 [Candidatus Moduliflexus flocculans]|nr:hypothetical protein [Candidatus Moduliflexus flocculans]
MSPSWIERLRARFEPAASVGLVIGRRRVGLVRVRRSARGVEIETLAEAELAVPLFTGKPAPEAIAALTDTLAALAGSLAREYLPVHVSLPDAAVRVAVFELEALPRTRAEQQELARWRLQQEAGAGTVACASQALGADGERQLLLGLAVDDAWRSAITAALAHAGITAWSLSADCCRQFNRFHDRLAADSGALVSVSEDCWALLLWDSAGRVRYARACWRAAGDDHADLAAEIERSIAAYAHGAAGRSVAHVYVIADAADAALPAALDARLRIPCVQLTVQDELVATAEVDLARVSRPRCAGGGAGTMRTAANLLGGRAPLALPLAALLWALGAMLAVVALVLVAAALDMRAERPRLEQRLARVDEQYAPPPRPGMACRRRPSLRPCASA